MRIGEVAERAGVTVKTVRHYESLGLIASSRLLNGYRDYDGESVRLVAEANALGRAGIPLERTRPFLDCLAAGGEHADDCPATRPAYREAIAELTSRIDELQHRRAALEELLESAEARTEAGCQFAASAAVPASSAALGGAR